MYNEYIEKLIELESAFKKAGQLALEMRETAKVSNKTDSDNPIFDVVTDADLAVQEAILIALKETKLVECTIVAEENTQSVAEFKGKNGLTLAIDPIDGTLLYTSGGRFFSVIISLKDEKSLLYTFVYYPAVDWARRITEKGVEDFGILPQAKIKDSIDLSRTIAYLKKPAEDEIYTELLKEGYIFRSILDITDDASAFTLLFLDQVAGYCINDPGAYDSLGALHYGQVKNFIVNSTVDLSKLLIGPYGQYYRGWYYVLRK